MWDHQMPRRGFLKTAALGAAGAAVGLPAADSPAVASPGPLRAGPDALRLGVASYSLRKFPRDKMIQMTKALNTPFVNIKSFHLEYELAPAQAQAAAREIEAAGLQIVGGGTITFDENTDEGVRKYFEYAKNAHMPLMVVTTKVGIPPQEILPRVEKFAKQYDIQVAIHNHGPEDKVYPSPYDVLKYVGKMDRRMGCCIDIGHTVRTGVDVVKSLRDAGPRLLDLHIKDLRNLSDKDSQVAVGQGAMPIAAIFRTLLDMNYQGAVNLEYEINADDPMPGMIESFAHMRGVLRGLEAGCAPNARQTGRRNA